MTTATATTERIHEAPIGVGVIGVGRIGELHAGNLAGCVPGASLRCVIDADAARAKEVGNRFGVAAGADWAQALEDPTVDAVVIATPSDQHAPISEAAADANRHIFCEKPLAVDLPSAEQCVAGANAAGVVLQIGFHLRHDPDFAATRAAFRAGELGELLSLRVWLRDAAPPPASYLAQCGGLLHDAAAHLLDLARWMVDEIQAVTAFGAWTDSQPPTANEPTISMLLVQFAAGGLGVLENCRSASYGFDCALELMGTTGTIRSAANRRTGLEWLSAGSASVDHVIDFQDRFGTAYVTEMRDFIGAIRDGRPPLVTGADAIAAATLADAAERSLHQAERIVLTPPVGTSVIERRDVRSAAHT